MTEQLATPCVRCKGERVVRFRSWMKIPHRGRKRVSQWIECPRCGGSGEEEGES